MLQSLLKLLLDGLKRDEAPVFSLARLHSQAGPAVTTFLDARILSVAPHMVTLEHPTRGMLLVYKYGTRYVAREPDAAGSDFIEVSEEDIKQVRLSQRRLMEWIAEANDMAGQSTFNGVIWTIGTTLIQDVRCRVMYAKAPCSRENMLLATSNIEVPGNGVCVLLCAAATGLTDIDLNELESRRIYVDHLYRIVSGNGFDLNKVNVPRPTISRKPQSYFRRSADGWEVGFNTTKPRAVKDKSGMEAIWWLLRNPGNKRAAEQLLLELAGLDPEKSPVMSAGSRAKSVKDLPSNVKAKLKELYQEAERCREDQDERGLADAQEEMKVMFKQYGIKDPFAGKVEREGDDKAKAGNSLGVAIGRCFSAFKKTKELEGLADHLEAYIDRWTSFSYDPPGEIPWITT
ncbi:MAG: hypothetical protein K9N47_25285 [Prosthecobacter sp.]|uniref:hypothetical protein n=1 Tax=Prosthecobacter sp. TaxID=1965333 RepID=UPI0026113A39|nr:hypothetical protein [Prosthecobacter sp.]MCF7789461.1 hypothetical protein [Prosthecobacter sp.]